MSFEEFILTILAAGMSFNYVNLIEDVDAIVIYYPDKCAGLIKFPRECIYDFDWEDRMEELSKNMQIVI